jgi:hypothetical protein
VLSLLGRRLGAVFVLIALAVGLVGWLAPVHATADGRDSRITTPLQSDQTPAVASQPRPSRSVVPPPSLHAPLPNWGHGAVIVLATFAAIVLAATADNLDRLARHRSRSLRSPPRSRRIPLSPAA